MGWALESRLYKRRSLNRGPVMHEFARFPFCGPNLLIVSINKHVFYQPLRTLQSYYIISSHHESCHIHVTFHHETCFIKK